MRLININVILFLYGDIRSFLKIILLSISEQLQDYKTVFLCLPVDFEFLYRFFLLIFLGLSCYCALFDKFAKNISMLIEWYNQSGNFIDV